MDCIGSRCSVRVSAISHKVKGSYYGATFGKTHRRCQTTPIELRGVHTRPHATRIPDRAIMTQRTYRIDNRASAASSRTPLARTVTVTLIALTLLARPASAKWLGGTTTANGGTVSESRQGNTRIVQITAGTPVATQIAYDTGSSNPPEAHVVLQDHSVILVPTEKRRAEGYKPSYWGKPTSVFGSINWGHGSGEFATAQAATMLYGDKDLGDEALTGAAAMRSQMAYGYVSYHVKNGASSTLGENQFFVTAGSHYMLNGCPNYKPGETSESKNYVCPRVSINPGDFKFSILGLLSGTQINSGHASSYGNYAASTSPHYRDMANYKSLVMTSTLDISNVGTAGTSRAAWVSFANGTKVNFTDITPDMDLAGCKMHIVNTASTTDEKEIIISFAQTYSTGKFTRSYDAMVAEFGACAPTCAAGDGTGDGCSGSCFINAMRDLTGFGDSPESYPMNAGIAAKKMGKGGLSASDARVTGNPNHPSLAAAQETPATATKDLQGLAGAPTLAVSEVRAVKITMRKHGGCEGRPAKPVAADPSGELGISWPGAPVDCPSFYLASLCDPTNPSLCMWNTEFLGAYKGIPAEDLSFCKAGDMNCFLIDIHLALELDDGTRTVLGSPENDSVRGWQKGTFFMYDPEVSDDPNKPFPPGYNANLKPGTSVIDVPPQRGADGKEAEDDTFMFGLTLLVFAAICAGIVLLIAVLVCCVVLSKRRARIKVSAEISTKPAGKDVEKA